MGVASNVSCHLVPSNNLEYQFTELLTQFLSEQPAINTFYVGLSGGADSSALLLLLKHCLPESVNLFAIHVNHGISQHADRWQQHCQQLCAELAVNLHCHRLQLSADTPNLEQVARQQRIGIFQQYQNPQCAFVLGHHEGDQAETLMMRLIRGAGLSGLTGIKPVNRVADLLLWRPLLAFNKQALTAYLSGHQLSWVEDESNQDEHYLRNFVRQQVLPLLAKRQPRISQQLCQTAQHLSEADLILNQYLDKDLKLMVKGEALTLERLNGLEQAKQALLIRRWLQNLGVISLPDTAHLQQVLTFIGREVDYAEISFKKAKLVLDKGLMYFSKQWHLMPFKRKITFGENILPMELGCLQVKQGEGPLAIATKWLSQLEVSSRPTSVNLRPKGRGHSRSLKKLMQEYAVPRHLRSVIPVVMVGQQVVLLPGYFVNQDFAAEDDQGLCIDWQHAPLPNTDF